MLKGTAFFTFNLLIVLIMFSVIHIPFLAQKNHFKFHRKQSQNHAPVVKILSPKNNDAFRWNSQVPYEISVSDKEDGESKYQEINPKEVFLEIKYVNDTSKALALIKKNDQKDPPGLATIKISNCMNCHAFKSKVIGPSFYEITRRYEQVTNSKDTLANHILNGSKGRWGNVQMPSNDKLNASEAKEVIEWIFKTARDSTVNYLAGTEGSFRLNATANSLKNIILIASYTDHGIKDQPYQNMKGEDLIIIHGK
ncbi:MAG TPA: c-type cytochrome [Hanamia sp.]|nr:c-type cytochrome [Hanamia sp.]